MFENNRTTPETSRVNVGAFGAKPTENSAANVAEHSAPNTSAEETKPTIGAGSSTGNSTESKRKTSRSRSKRGKNSRREILNKRLRELEPIVRKHDLQNAELHSELDALNKELHEMDIADLDSVCGAKGITTEELISYLREVKDTSEIKAQSKKVTDNE